MSQTRPLIVDNGIDMSPYAKNVTGNSQFMIDLCKNPEKALKDLNDGIISKEEINHQNNEKWSPLHYVCRNAKSIIFSDKIIDIFFKNDIDVNLQNKNGSTALMLASKFSNTDSTEKTVKMLLKNKDINVNLQNNDGNTALMLASKYSNTTSTDKTVELLLKHPKINVNLQNKYGRTALKHATKYFDTNSTKKTVEILQKYINLQRFDENIKQKKKQIVEYESIINLTKAFLNSYHSDELLQCPVCLDDKPCIELELLDCGHHICTVCYPRLKNTCAMCRAKF